MEAFSRLVLSFSLINGQMKIYSAKIMACIMYSIVTTAIFFNSYTCVFWAQGNQILFEAFVNRTAKNTFFTFSGENLNLQQFLMKPEMVLSLLKQSK